MNFGANTLLRGSNNPEVEELQICLAGFRGTTWDGDFGPGTELQVIAFQTDYMKIDRPTGVVDNDMLSALKRFSQEIPVDFQKLRCPCGECDGFGQNRFEGEYREGKPKIEAYHNREYPGIHKAILQTYRAAQFYATKAGFDMSFFASGYRCWVNNGQKNRKSTNHMGKALDIDFPMKPRDDKRDDCNRCDNVRALLVDKCGFQIGWAASNRKALEPSNIAPSWIHMDVRCYSEKYLSTKYFVKSAEELDMNVL